MTGLLIRIIRYWLPLAVAVSAIYLSIYVVIQQEIRMSANDPQIQMAQDMANYLNTNKFAQISGTVDVSQSLAPFTIIYNLEGVVINANAILDNITPSLPSGVLQQAKKKGENRITWQPKPGVRLATVVVPFKEGFVLVGRNMREIEFREHQQFGIVAFMWIMTTMATLFFTILLQTFFRKNK